MKTILALSILFSLIVLPALGALSEADLNQIRLIVKEEIKTEINALEERFDGKIDALEKRFDGKIDDKFNALEKRFDSIEKNFDRQSAFIIACIAIPMALITLMIAWRSVKDNSQQKQIEVLKQEIETLKQQRIVNP